MSSEGDRLERLVSDLQLRVRDVETAEKYSSQRAVDLSAELRTIIAEVHAMDVNGTAMTKERFIRIEDQFTSINRTLGEFKDEWEKDLSEIKSSIKECASGSALQEIKDDAKTLRLTIRGAIITFATSIAIQVFIYFLLRPG